MSSGDNENPTKSPLGKPYGTFVKRVRDLADELLDDLLATVDQQADVNSLTGADKVKADIALKLVDALRELTKGVTDLKNGDNPSNKSKS